MLEGTQVGAYRVLQRIGSGGMGSVWIAEHVALGRRAALKMLHPEMTVHPEMVARFFNEARATTAITDPGIVQIFDFGQHVDGRAYIVMELLEGEPLDRRLKREGSLSLLDGLRLMRQVASTLGAAHLRGVIHRDVKPENIFIVRDPEVAGGERTKVLDFGIAKLVGDQAGALTHTSAVMGTPTFMSPEQCRGAGRVDQRSDVYALGCVLFTLVAGRPPFVSEGVGDIIAMHLREPPPTPSQLRAGVPHEIDRLVLRCLAKDPGQRFQTASELATAIDALLSALHLSPAIPALGTSNAITTLSGATGASHRMLAARTRVGIVTAGIGVGALGGAVALIVVRGGTHEQHVRAPPPTPEPTASPLPTVAAAPSAGSAASPTESPTPAAGSAASPTESPTPAAARVRQAPPDPKVTVVPSLKDTMTKFLAWSHDHPGAPCPDAGLLGAPDDPWGHPPKITCTRQPADQMAGAISAGPDGVSGTDDDIASWQLGAGVTDIVRGARWQVAPAAPPAARPRPAASPTARPQPAAPPTSPARAPTKSAPLQLDENGLPIHR